MMTINKLDAVLTSCLGGGLHLKKLKFENDMFFMFSQRELLHTLSL